MFFLSATTAREAERRAEGKPYTTRDLLINMYEQLDLMSIARSSSRVFSASYGDETDDDNYKPDISSASSIILLLVGSVALIVTIFVAASIHRYGTKSASSRLVFMINCAQGMAILAKLPFVFNNIPYGCTISQIVLIYAFTQLWLVSYMMLLCTNHLKLDMHSTIYSSRDLGLNRNYELFLYIFPLVSTILPISTDAFEEKRKVHLKPSKVLPVLPLQPKPSNDYCTPTKCTTSSFGTTAFSQFGTIETNLQTDECSYMDVRSTDMSPSNIQTRINPRLLVYYRNNQTGDILSYRRKMQNGRSNLGFKACRGKGMAGPGSGLALLELPASPIKRCASA
jgi:hypothetical protein